MTFSLGTFPDEYVIKTEKNTRAKFVNVEAILNIAILDCVYPNWDLHFSLTRKFKASVSSIDSNTILS